MMGGNDSVAFVVIALIPGRKNPKAQCLCGLRSNG